MAAIVFSLDDGNNREMFREHGAMILDSALSSGSRVIVVHDDDDSSGQTHDSRSRDLTSRTDLRDRNTLQLTSLFALSNAELCRNVIGLDSSGSVPEAVLAPAEVVFKIKHSTNSIKDSEVYLELARAGRKHSYDFKPATHHKDHLVVAHQDLPPGHEHVFPGMDKFGYPGHELDGQDWVLVGLICQRMFLSDLKVLPFGIKAIKILPANSTSTNPRPAVKEIHGIKTLIINKWSVGWDEDREEGTRYAMAFFWFEGESIEALVNIESRDYHGSGKSNRNYVRSIMAYAFNLMLKAKASAEARPWFQPIIEQEEKKRTRVKQASHIRDPGLRKTMEQLPMGFLVLTPRPESSQIRSRSTSRIVELDDESFNEETDNAGTPVKNEHHFSSDPVFSRDDIATPHERKRTGGKARKKSHAQPQSVSMLQGAMAGSERQMSAAATDRGQSQSPPLSLERVRKNKTRERTASISKPGRERIASPKGRARARASRRNSEASTELSVSPSTVRGDSPVRDRIEAQFSGNQTRASVNDRGCPPSASSPALTSITRDGLEGIMAVPSFKVIDTPAPEWETVTRKKQKLRDQQARKADGSNRHAGARNSSDKDKKDKTQTQPLHGQRRATKFNPPKQSQNLFAELSTQDQSLSKPMSSQRASTLDSTQYATQSFTMKAEDYPSLPPTTPRTISSKKADTPLASPLTQKSSSSRSRQGARALSSSSPSLSIHADQSSPASPCTPRLPRIGSFLGADEPDNSLALRLARSPVSEAQGPASPSSFSSPASKDEPLVFLTDKEIAMQGGTQLASSHGRNRAGSGIDEEAAAQPLVGLSPLGSDHQGHLSNFLNYPSAQPFEPDITSIRKIRGDFTRFRAKQPKSRRDSDATLRHPSRRRLALDADNDGETDLQSPAYALEIFSCQDTLEAYWRKVYEPEPHRPSIYGTSEQAGSYMMSLDVVSVPCALHTCGKKCTSWDGTSVICPRCGPYSYVRYCSERDLFRDLKFHWLYCQTSNLGKTCNPSSIPRRHGNIVPFIPCLRSWDTPERHRQGVYHSISDEGDYFVFDDHVRWARAGFPRDHTFADLRCRGEVKHVISFAFDDVKDAAKDRFNRLLNVALFDSIRCEHVVRYLYRMIRSNLESRGLWDIETSQCLDYQMQFEFGLLGWVMSSLEPSGHACIDDWNGVPSNNCLNTACRKRKVQDFKNGCLNGGVRHLVEDMENKYWVLRVSRIYHPTVSNQQNRMRGVGFDSVSVTHQRIFSRGEGWDGYGMPPIELEGVKYATPSNSFAHKARGYAALRATQYESTSREAEVFKTGGVIVQSVGEP